MDSENLFSRLCEHICPVFDEQNAGGNSPVTKELFIYASQRHRVGSLLDYAVRMSGQDLSEDVLRRLSNMKMRCEQDYLKRKAVQEKLVSLFTGQDIRTISLKGCSLSEQLYENPSMRSAKDIDILVAPADADSAMALLSESGFESPKPRIKALRGAHMNFVKDIPFYDPQFGVQIELHQRLLLAEPDEFTSDFMASLEGGTFPHIGNDHYLLYLILHGAMANWPRLKWVIDMILLLRKLDAGHAGRLMVLSEKYRCTSSVIASLKLLDEIFPECFGDAWMEQVRAHPATSKIKKLHSGFAETLKRSDTGGRRIGFPFAENYIFDGGVHSIRHIPARLARPIVQKL